MHTSREEALGFLDRETFFVSMFRLLSIGRKVVAHEMDLADTSAYVFYGITCFQFSSVTQSCLTLCDPMEGSMSGLPVHHQLPEFTQIHVHRVGDVIQPSHPLSSPSPPIFNLSQHQGLFK